MYREVCEATNSRTANISMKTIKKIKNIKVKEIQLIIIHDKSFSEMKRLRFRKSGIN